MSDSRLTLRTAGPADVPALVDLGARTFLNTYTDGNDPAEVRAQVAVSYTEEIVGAALRTPGVTYLVAEFDGALCGFAKVMIPSHEDGIEAARPAEVNQLYVDHARHGRGVGRALLDASAEHARRAGCDYLWLGVWERNANAIAFYERLGLVRVGTHAFLFGSEVQTDLLMGLPLG